MYKPRWYQDEAEYAIVDYFARKKGDKRNPIVVMPTGTGKSIVIASFIKNAMATFPNTRIMMLTHVKQLIEQNAEKLVNMWANAPVGIHSAGLNSRDIHMPIIFGGVQSVCKVIEKFNAETAGQSIPTYNQHFGFRDLLIVDECHLIGDAEGAMYTFVINELMKINPYLNVIGFTATPYRLKQGLLTEGNIFTDICYDISGVRSFNRLIEEGFLAPLIPRPTDIKLDFSGVKLVGGEFNNKQASSIIDTDENTYKAVREMVTYGYDRKSWLVFASNVDNAEHVADMLNQFGIESAAVHSKMPAKKATAIIDAFKAGEIKALVNKNMLTTGFDHPPIDLIGDLSATTSPALNVQKLGRGTRPSEGKANCLVLDFVGNVPRCGPINDPILPKKAGKGGGEAPIKICPAKLDSKDPNSAICRTYNHASVRFCAFCGFEFIYAPKHYQESGTEEIIRKNEEKEPVLEYFKVHNVIYNMHQKKDRAGNIISAPMLKVSYFAGMHLFNEYVLLENERMKTKVADWWKQRHSQDVPPTTYQALQMVSELRKPEGITVRTDGKYPEIISVEW